MTAACLTSPIEEATWHDEGCCDGLLRRSVYYKQTPKLKVKNINTDLINTLTLNVLQGSLFFYFTKYYFFHDFTFCSLTKVQMFPKHINTHFQFYIVSVLISTCVIGP